VADKPWRAASSCDFGWIEFELPPGRFHCTFEVREAHGHERLDDQFALHIVQLPLLHTADALAPEHAGALLDWARYFKATEDEELEALAMSDPIFDKAKLELERLSSDPQVRRLALEREEALAMYHMELHEARREGKAEGRTEGKAEGLATAVLRLLEGRGIEVPQDARDRIGACRDIVQLQAWLDAAIGATRIEDVLGS
jgi:hypothetical protein